MLGHAFNINDIDFFRLWNGTVLDRRVFLMFPVSKSTDIRLLTIYFKDLGAEVLTTLDEGSWKLFTKKPDDSGVIIYHPSMYNYQEMPNFSSTLFGKYNHFQLGKDPDLLRNRSDEGGYECVQLFPRDGLYLLTDEVLAHHPNEIATLLLYLQREQEATGLQHHVLVRPLIREFLLDLLAKHQYDKATGKTYRNLYMTISDILDEQDEMDLEEDMGPTALLTSPPSEEMPKYLTFASENQQSATNYLVSWFAGYALLHREKLRYFQVVYDNPGSSDNDQGELGPTRWKREYQHIVVESPDQVLERCKQRNSGST